MKISDKIGHINCDTEALKNPDFVNAINAMCERAYNMVVKENAEEPIEQEERPYAKDYFNDLTEVYENYTASPKLFTYAQSLEKYIDFLTKPKQS